MCKSYSTNAIIGYKYPKIFRRKDGSLDRFIEIKTTLAQMRRI